MITMVLTDILINGGIATIISTVLRNSTGFIKYVLQDGKIEGYELKLLGVTIVSMFFYATAFTMLGLDTEVSAALAALSDVGISALKSLGTVTTKKITK